MAFERPWDVWLCTAVCAGCIFDYTEQRLPNRLTLLLLGGAVSKALLHAGLAGLAEAILSGLAGSVILFGAWLRRWLGGGDVKFFFALCCYLSLGSALEALLVASVLGGAVFVVQLYWYWRPTPSGAARDLPRMPYALALSGGFVWAASGPAHFITIR